MLMRAAIRSLIIGRIPLMKLSDREEVDVANALAALEVVDQPVLVFKPLADGRWRVGPHVHRNVPKGVRYAHDAISAALAGLPAPPVPQGVRDNTARTAIRTDAVQWAYRKRYHDVAYLLLRVSVESGYFVFDGAPPLPKLELN
jgi:hypothetical protein